MAYLEDLEYKTVKRNKFGPIDVYPQEERQKEDELSAESVKSGFKYLISDLLRENEFQSSLRDQSIANNANLDNDVMRTLIQIINKREEANINNQSEANKKQQVPAKTPQQTFRPSLILITGNQKTKEAAYAWFKLLANNEPLTKLSKKIPVFNKRADNLPEILITLHENQVPITRVIWYLKIMVLAYSTNVNDAQKKKRQQNIDVASEWSLPLSKLLREIFSRLQMYEQLPGCTLLNQQQLALESFMNVENLSLILLPMITTNYLTESKLKALWTFSTKLMRAMLDQNLLDKQFMLECLIDLLDKSTFSLQLKHSNPYLIETSSTKLVLTTISQNMFHFLQSELLSRRLAFYCCKRISALFNEYSNCLFESTIKKLDTNSTKTTSQLPLLSNTQLPQQQQSSPELNKLKPFVTNVNQSASFSLQNSQKKSQSQLSSLTSSTNASSQHDFSLASHQAAESIDYILKKKVSVKEIKGLFDQIFQCSLHREQLILMTSIVHAIQLGCMQALIWNNVGDGRVDSPFNGSPLDYLPCAPSRLLYTYDYMGIDKLTKQFVRTELEKAELCIRRRSTAVENKWATDKLRQASIGAMQIKTLAILDVLDKYCYDIVDVNETIDSIYKQIFPELESFANKKKKRKLSTRENTLNENAKVESMEIDSESELENFEQFTYDTEDEEDETDLDDDYNEEDQNKPLSDREIIHILCDWAITVKRSGVHRIYYAVFLIKKRHIDLIRHHTETCQMLKQKLKASLLGRSIRKLGRGVDENESDEQKQFDTSQNTIDQTISITLSNLKKRKLNDSLTNEENAPNDNVLLSSAKKFKTQEDASELGESKLNITTFSLNSTSMLNEATSIVTGKSPSILHKVSTENSNLNNSMNRDVEEKPTPVKIKRIKEKLTKLSRYEEEKTYDYYFQRYLFEYLENKGVQLDEKSNESRIMFTNLVSLYYMFINSKLFSHDQFVTTLITRGETFKNNLSDIKCPKQFLNKRQTMSSNVKQEQAFNLQHQLSQPNLQHPMSQMVQNRQNSIEYASPMSAYQQPASMPAFNIAPQTPLQHQKSITNMQSSNMDPLYPHSVPTPSKSLILNQSSQQLDDSALVNNNQLNNSYDAKSVQQYQQSVRSVSSVKTPLQSTSNNVPALIKRTLNQQNKPMSKLAQYVMHIPIPFSEQYRHERNQRIVVLYGFGSKKQEIMDKLLSISKNLKNLFSSKNSFDLSHSSSNSNFKKFHNTITSLHLNVSTNEQDNLNQIYSDYSKLTYYDQYSLLNKLVLYVIEIYKSLENKNHLPKLQYIQFIFDLMESNSNIFNLLLFAIRLLNVAPNIESFLRKKFNLNSSQQQANNQPKPFFEYLSYFYLNLIGVFRLHLASLVMWKELASQVFKCLFQLVKSVERPSKCSTHEKCAFMLLNEMFNVCSYLKQQFPQFEPLALKIKQEKCFVQLPQFDKTTLNSVMKSDETLIAMFTTSDHTINEIEAYLVSKNFYYNFVAHVFVSMSNSNMSKDDMLRLANLCAELSCRLNILIPLWHFALRTLLHRDAEPTKEKTMLFRELLNKINIQNAKCKENFKLFLSIMASRHCLLMTEFIINVVKTCVMAVPGITSDQSHDYTILEPTAWLACHILHYLFTSSPKPLVYRRLTSDQRMVTANFRSICFNTFLLVLKGLFLLSGTKREVNSTKSSSSSKSSSKSNNDKQNQAGNADENAELELDQYALNVLYEICEHDWIKERCFYEGDNLLKPNQLLESALNRKAQNLLHIICYPKAYHMRKQQEQASNKDFTKNILQNLDLWNLRESLLEFKLMIELEKQKENRYYEYFIECLAKTTVDFLIDSDTQMQNAVSSSSSSSSNQSVQRSNSVLSNSNQISEPLSNEPATQASADENSQQTQLANPSSVNNLNEQSMSESTQDQQMSGEQAMNGEMRSAENENEMEQIESSEDDFDMFDQPDASSNVNQLYQTSHTVGVWLVAPLINKLQDSCQLKVLENASKILQDLGKSFWNAKNKVEKETQVMRNISAWSQQPFFSLLISCLKGKDEQRLLLNSLFYGLMDFINGKDDKILSENPRIRQIMHDTLHIRLSLVGSMFDFIMKNSNDFINWAWLFVQLICSGVIDPDNDQLLFTIVADMFVVLMHHIITLEPNLENNKHYQSIIKKISKETKDLSELPNTKAINYVRRLMPLNKSACLDVLIVDHHVITASKSISNQHDKRRAFKFSRKEKINTWELIEGVKNASAICSSWYGLARIERRMLKYEYQQKLLVRHKHMNIHKELTYFKEKCDVPNDLIEVSESALNALTQPPAPPQSPVKKQESKANDSMSKISSPSTQTADIVLIGSTAGHSHSQIMGRLQNQVSNNEKKATKTPDKQKTSTKKRANSTTTPRRNAAAAAAAAPQQGVPQTGVNPQQVGVNPNTAPVGGPMNPAMRNPNQMVMPPNHPTALQTKFMASQGQPIQQQQQQQQSMQSPMIRSTSSPMPQQPPAQVGNQPYTQQYPNNPMRTQQPVPQPQQTGPHQNLNMNPQMAINNRMGTSTPPMQPANSAPIGNPNQYVQNSRQGMMPQQQMPGRPGPAPGYNPQQMNPVAQPPVQPMNQAQQRKAGPMAPNQQPPQGAQMPNQLPNSQAMFNQQQMASNQAQMNQQRMMPNQQQQQQPQSAFAGNPQVGQPKPGQTIPRNSTPDPMLMNTPQPQMMQKQPQQMPNYPNNQAQAPQQARMQFAQQQPPQQQQQNFAWQQQDAQRNQQQLQQRPQQMQTPQYQQQQTQQGMPPQGMPPGQQQQQYMQNKGMQPGQNMMNPNMQQQQQQRGMPPNQQYQNY